MAACVLNNPVMNFPVYVFTYTGKHVRVGLSHFMFGLVIVAYPM